MKPRMTEHPILFSTPMVQAILKGRKMMTRRIVKPQPADHYFQSLVLHASGRYTWAPSGNFNPEDKEIIEVKFPYGHIGDTLWVREEHKIFFDSKTKEWVCEYKDGTIIRKYYKKISLITNENLSRRKSLGKWQRARFMPKDLSRIWLEITNISVERLHNISETDAIAEGVGSGFQMNSGYPDYQHIVNGVCEVTQDTAVMSFCSLWSKINGAESWNANPWVWVVTFKKL
jgi:hypothetical protein